MKKRVLLVYTSFNTFVEADYHILSLKYSVDKYEFRANKKAKAIAVQLLKQFLFLLLNLRSYNAVYVWFGDYHSVLPIVLSRIFRKKSYIVIGGYDVARLPEYKYGSLCLPVVEKLE